MSRRPTRTKQNRGFRPSVGRSAGGLLRGPAFIFLAAATLLIALVSISAPASPRDSGEAQRRGTRESVHELSRQLVTPRNARSQRAAAGRALRGLLRELRSEIDGLEADSSGRMAAQLERRGAQLRAAYERIRVRHGAPAQRAKLEDRFSDLFAQIDRAAAAPAERGARLTRLRRLIDEALGGRPESRSLRIVVSDGPALSGELAE